MATPLQIPAMRGVMGDWIYYVALLPFREVSNRIKKTEEIHSSPLLRMMIQRAVNRRVPKKLRTILSLSGQRFFNAIVVGVYEGEPEWHRLNVKKSNCLILLISMSQVAESLGILTLRGDEKTFCNRRSSIVWKALKSLTEPLG